VVNLPSSTCCSDQLETVTTADALVRLVGGPEVMAFRQDEHYSRRSLGTTTPAGGRNDKLSS